ncbi:MAG TPA: molybdopterin-dependent oxidoreductase [Chitinophagaceae bacterium]|nr:molybdopterin-dependent oxidoreductase [Chitinophagaceae bacterium]
MSFISHLPKKEQVVAYPKDRRVVIGLGKKTWIALILILGIPVIAAWVQYLGWGLPADPSASFTMPTASEPSGFPAWIRVSHWVNFLFLTLIIRSGLSILFDHPRLYFNSHCTPHSEWLRFTPIKVPSYKMWTAKQDARYLSPWIGLPGYKHTVGRARNWHFITVPFFVLNGVIFIVLLFVTNQWQRLVPTSWQIIPDAWNIFVHYITFNFPIEPNAFYHYNALQKIAYFAVVFVLAPLAMLSGIGMSPAIKNRFPWYTKLFKNRQGARSVHFLVMVAYVIFIIVHVALVASTGLIVNMNHITLGLNKSTSLTGLIIGSAIILFVILCWYFATWLSWHYPRALQKLQRDFNGNLWRMSINRLKPREDYYTQKDISPYFWPNGNLPKENKEWRDLARDDFKDYKLKVGGMVDNPQTFSLDELKELAQKETITMHHCIQGWSGIAEWKGIPIKKIVEIVKPHDKATTVAFISFGKGLYGTTYYDTHTLDNCLKPGALLAWEMNYKPLSIAHGAPLRLRIENQLGYKMVKWIESIEFIEGPESIGKGHGGRNEDDEYYDLLADI